MTGLILESKGLSLVAGEKTLCSQLYFSIPQGRLVALLGRNGSGKTTLLKSLAGLRDPDMGEILYGGHSLKSLSAGQRARRIALLLASRSGDETLRGAEFVALGRWPFTPWHGGLNELDFACVRKAMEETETLALENRRLNQLSDGEKQKLGLARVLAQQTPILLLDEPLSHLDAPSQIQMLDLLRKKASQDGKSILFSCHDLNLAFHAAQDLLVLLPEGKWRMGSPVEVFGDKECRAHLGMDAAKWLTPAQ